DLNYRRRGQDIGKNRSSVDNDGNGRPRVRDIHLNDVAGEKSRDRDGRRDGRVRLALGQRYGFRQERDQPSRGGNAADVGQGPTRRRSDAQCLDLNLKKIRGSASDERSQRTGLEQNRGVGGIQHGPAATRSPLEVVRVNRNSETGLVEPVDFGRGYPHFDTPG